ncbi:MAG: isoprenylcysteine carboxylmethyltransferase family protein [Planctomycetes bacterium]|nr:isoprenylcysteine carboxylmethyltransferase family protein [Planctomycetota bacterium]
MSSAWAVLTVLVANVALVAIRAPHGQRSRAVPVARSFAGGLEKALLTFAWFSFFVPFVWMATSLFDVAEFRLHPAAFVTGVAAYVVGLWVFHRSHADLGRAWSITLELREDHALVTHGVYAHVRHAMYLGLLLFGLGQALVLPNWIAGPTYLLAMVLITALRLGPEERMMREAFGAEYDAYAARTRRLLPGIW